MYTSTCNFKKLGGSGLDNVILLSKGGGGLVFITVEWGGGGVKNAKKLIALYVNDP